MIVINILSILILVGIIYFGFWILEMIISQIDCRRENNTEEPVIVYPEVRIEKEENIFRL
tara:strand:- start:189 stop:368 length:180 start_codon:yes stop_codon:yes gene_type:complete